MNKQFWRFMLMLVILSASMLIASAQVTPKMAVYTVWTPDEQLTSITGDDRYVDLQIYAQGNVPFWAVNVSCTVGTATVLDLVDMNPHPVNEEFLTFPSEWGVEDTDFFYSPNSDAALYTGAGVLAFTATRLGATNSQLGMNGQDYTQLIATARFKVRDTVTANTQATVTCTLMDFIDRNGAVAIKGKQTKFNNLMIYTGYTLTGVARRQGTNLNQNIEVSCGLLNNFNATKQTVYTASNGTFRFAGTAATPLRHLGLYRCNFESEFVQGNPNNQVLLGYLDFEMNTAVMNLLPVTLRTGDANNSGTVEFTDIISITGAIGAPNIGAFGNPNDMNGDGQVSRLDIIFPAGNLGLSDAGNGYLAEHVLYGIGRDLATNFTYPNSRIWLGNATSADVSNFNTRSTTRDFWPTLSPDGSTIAYVSQTASTGKHGLSLLATSTGVITPLRFPTTFNYEAFAPSWSPDGNRIAFVCSVNNPSLVNAGYLYNRGDICVMNAADRSGLQINRLGVEARVFPPSWMSYDTDTVAAGEQTGFVLLYGGVDGDIHYYDFVSSTHGVLTIGDAAVADVLDMPVAVNYAYDNNTYLVYRFNDNDSSFDPYLRVGTLSYNGTSFTGSVTDVLDVDHVSLNAIDQIGVDYFDVSPNLDIMFYYEYNHAKANPGTVGNEAFIYVTLAHNDLTPLSWGSSVTHLPDSSVGHPVGISGSSGTYHPSGMHVNPTYLHIWRMSFDYIP